VSLSLKFSAPNNGRLSSKIQAELEVATAERHAIIHHL
jgi:hypothetical protein